MTVKGKEIRYGVTIEIGYDETMEAVKEAFGIPKTSDMVILDADDKKNDTGKKGLFYVKDISYHGSPIYKYSLYSDDEEVIRAYELISELDKIHFDKVRRECK